MPAGRRARLTISRIDPWTVLKFSALLYVCFYLILMVAGTALWVAGTVTGLRDNVESFVGELISSPNFKFFGGRILQASALGGAVLVMVGTGANVLMAVLYNLIREVVGGVGVTLDEPPSRQGTSRTDAGVGLRDGPRRRFFLKGRTDGGEADRKERQSKGREPNVADGKEPQPAKAESARTPGAKAEPVPAVSAPEATVPSAPEAPRPTAGL